MNISVSVITGVFSGVITAALVWISGLVLSRIVMPWYLQLIYRGVDVNGSWLAQYNHLNGFIIQTNLQIVQRAHSISGHLTLVQEHPSVTAIVNSLDLTGHVWEGFITLSMQSSDRSRLSFGAGLIKVTEGGSSLSGTLLFRNIQTELVESAAMIFEKNNQKLTYRCS